MSRTYATPAPRPAAARRAAASDDAIGALMIRQRPSQRRHGAAVLAEPEGEAITDLGEVARLLAGCLAQQQGDDDLVFELLMLEAMLAEQPVGSDDLLEQLGTLGEEVRDGMLPPGMINVAALRRRTRRVRQHLGSLASRVSAAMLVFLTGLPLFGQEAHAAEEREGGFAIASTPVVRVIDSNTSQPMAGVQIKTMEERLLGVTDGTGQATLGDGYLETDLLSLEKDGYEMYLLDRTQLSSRNIVTMKPLKDAPSLAGAPARGAAPAGHGAAPHASAATPGMKPPTPPKAPTPPKMARAQGHDGGHGAPVMVAPKPPTKPAAPTIRLPVRPRAKAADVHARTAPAHGAPAHAAPAARLAPVHTAAATAKDPDVLRPVGAEVGHAAAPTPEVRLPVRPKLPTAEHAATAPEGGHDAPAITLPKAPTSHAAPHAAPQAAGHHATGHRARPVAHHATASAAHERTLSLPSRPRRPMVASAHGGHQAPREAPHVAIPHRMPQPRLAGGGHTGGGGYYRVRPGDSLSMIAQRQLGSARRWRELFSANRDRVANPRFIRVGQTLVLPEHDAPGAGTSYVVRPGDCLFTIASSQLGSGTRWRAIWNANRHRIRDARFIYPGQVLTLPTA